VAWILATKINVRRRNPAHEPSIWGVYLPALHAFASTHLKASVRAVSAGIPCYQLPLMPGIARAYPPSMPLREQIPKSG
jgi:hypothetical protein